MRRTAVAAIFATFACAGAHAHDPQRNASPPIDSIFAGLIQEQDIALAMRYLQDSFDAALDGRESPPPDALIERGEVIAKEARRRGAATAHAVLEMVEGILREAVKGESRQLSTPDDARQLRMGEILLCPAFALFGVSPHEMTSSRGLHAFVDKRTVETRPRVNPH